MKSILDSLRLIPSPLRNRLISLTIFRAFFSIFDLIGISLVGIIGVLAVSPIGKKFSTTVFGSHLSITNSPDLIGKLMGVTFLLFVFKAVLSLGLNKINLRLISAIETEMAEQASAYFFLGSFENLREKPKADVQWTLLESVLQAFFITLSAFTALVVDIFTLLVIFILLFFVDPLACIFVTIYFSILGFGLQRLVGRWQHKIGVLQSESARGAWTAIEDAYVSYRESFVQQKTKRFWGRINSDRTKMSIAISQNMFLGTIPKSISEVALMLGILAFVSWLFLTGSLEESVGVVAVFLAAGVRIMSAMGPVQSSLSSLRNSAAQGSLAKEVVKSYQTNSQFAFPTNSCEEIHNHSISRGYEVEVNKIEFTYSRSDSKVLKDVSLQIGAGQLIAIIGPSGSGKTTLVDIILGLFEPQVGNVTISGMSVTKLVTNFPGSISYVPQRPGLISGTLRSNITLDEPVKDFNSVAFERAVQNSGLSDLVSSLDQGVETVIDGSNALFSGGQIQRIGLARALYSEPKLLILDEATSALDAETENSINLAIQNLRPQTTVIVIAHRLTTVQHADKVYLLENGMITASGSFSELRRNNPLVQQYVELMSFDEISETDL